MSGDFLNSALVVNMRRDNRRKWEIIVNYACQSGNYEDCVAVFANPLYPHPWEEGAGAETALSFRLRLHSPEIL